MRSGGVSANPCRLPPTTCNCQPPFPQTMTTMMAATTAAAATTITTLMARRAASPPCCSSTLARAGPQPSRCAAMAPRAPQAGWLWVVRWVCLSQASHGFRPAWAPLTCPSRAVLRCAGRPPPPPPGRGPAGRGRHPVAHRGGQQHHAHPRQGVGGGLALALPRGTAGAVECGVCAATVGCMAMGAAGGHRCLWGAQRDGACLLLLPRGAGGGGGWRGGCRGGRQRWQQGRQEAHHQVGVDAG